MALLSNGNVSGAVLDSEAVVKYVLEYMKLPRGIRVILP